MNELTLTVAEKEIYDRLPAALRDGWKVKAIDTPPVEKPEELYMRYRIAHFTDSRCTAIADKVKKAKTAAEIALIAADFDIASLPQEQLAELFFVLGVRVLSGMIEYVLANTDHDEDLEGVASLSAIRIMLVEANSVTP